MRFKLIIILILTINFYYTNKLIKFAKQSEKYFEYLELKTQCEMFKNSENRTDAYIAARGLRREDIKDSYKEFYQQRDAYDTQIPECLKFAKYMCWIVDDVNKKECGSDYGVTK